MCIEAPHTNGLYCPLLVTTLPITYIVITIHVLRFRFSSVFVSWCVTGMAILRPNGQWSACSLTSTATICDCGDHHSMSSPPLTVPQLSLSQLSFYLSFLTLFSLSAFLVVMCFFK